MYSIIILSIAMISIQLGSGIAKELFAIFGVIATSFLRVAIGSILLLLFFRPWRAGLRLKHFLNIIPYGASLGLMNITFYLALERIPLGITVAIEFLGPLGIAIFSSRRWQDFLWASLAMSGIFLLTPLSNINAQELDPIGILYALAAATSWAIYIIFGKKTAQKTAEGEQGISQIAWAMTIASLVIFPGLFITKISMPTNFTPYLLITLVAFLSSAIPYTLELMALKKIPRHTFSILMSLEPVIAVLVGIILLHENLNWEQYLAIVFIIVASIGTTWKGTQKKGA